MKTICIYQLKETSAQRDIRYQTLETLRKSKIKVDIKNYDLVYKETLYMKVDYILNYLEILYSEFQYPIKDSLFKGRNMTVSDVVTVDRSSYYCDYDGFVKIFNFQPKTKK